MHTSADSLDDSFAHSILQRLLSPYGSDHDESYYERIFSVLSQEKALAQLKNYTDLLNVIFLLCSVIYFYGDGNNALVQGALCGAVPGESEGRSVEVLGVVLRLVSSHAYQSSAFPDTCARARRRARAWGAGCSRCRGRS